MNITSISPANQVFSFSRWTKLVTRHWVDNRKRFLLSLLAMTGLLAAWYSFILAMDKPVDPLNIFFQYSAYFCGLYATGCLYASTVFAELGSKKEGIGYLALPASHLEKLLCALLFGVVLFFVGFNLVFYLVDIPMVHLSNRLSEYYHRSSPHAAIVFNAFTAEGGPPMESNFHVFLFGYFTIQSAFILGSVYFARYAFLKTVIAVLLFLLALVLFISNGLPILHPPGWEAGLLSWWERVSPADEGRTVRLPASARELLTCLMRYGLPLILWFIAYVRLKEKEV